MKSICALLPALCLSAALAAEPGIKTEVVGGTAIELPSKSKVRMDYSGADALVFRGGKTELRVSYQKVSTLEYGQNVSRRYAAAILVSPFLLLSKSRKHFITLGYMDAEGRQQAIVIRVEKGDIRAVLAGLEARTGRRVEFQDADARKAVKG